jgi:2-polyprenyl-3-methyl-5-hydroxy-6-metoxy-1,4-benzoquinol methylase
MNFELKKYPCPCCKQDQSSLLLTKQGFHIVKCKGCGLVYVNPRISDEQIRLLYAHNYFHNREYGYLSYDQEKRLRRKNFERWLKDSNRYIKKGSIRALDVGCAAGYCMEMMKQRGWEVSGLELDEEMYERVKSQGYNVHKTTLGEFDTSERFSVITLFDVIEHIPDLEGAFGKLHELLTDEGIVVIVTPDHNSFQRRLFGKKWFQYKPIEHIQYFTKRSLTTFAERNGLVLQHAGKCGQYADTAFIMNRLNYYKHRSIASILKTAFRLPGLRERFFYLGTGSLFAVLKKKK